MIQPQGEIVTLPFLWLSCLPWAFHEFCRIHWLGCYFGPASVFWERSGYCKHCIGGGCLRPWFHSRPYAVLWLLAVSEFSLEYRSRRADLQQSWRLEVRGNRSSTVLRVSSILLEECTETQKLVVKARSKTNTFPLRACLDCRQCTVDAVCSSWISWERRRAC